MPIIHSPSTLTMASMRRDIAADLDRRLNDAATEASTGRKVDVYKSLGLKAGELLNIRTHEARNAGFLDGNALLANRLDVMSSALGGVRDVVQDFLEVSINYREGVRPTGAVLQDAARAAYEQIVSIINTPYEGTQLFAGIDSLGPTLQPWDEANPVSTLSPEDVMAAIVGGGITDAADASAKVAETALVFANANAAAPGANFEATFFNGAPLEVSPGVPSPRLSALIDTATSLNYGVQANDPAFTETLMGLAMIASVDPSQINDPAAYDAWMGAAIDAVGRGNELLVAAENQVGGRSQLLANTIERQSDRADLYQRQLNELEGVDQFEAASRVTALSTQLEATYAITARLSRLTFLNYL